MNFKKVKNFKYKRATKKSLWLTYQIIKFYGIYFLFSLPNLYCAIVDTTV